MVQLDITKGTVKDSPKGSPEWIEGRMRPEKAQIEDFVRFVVESSAAYFDSCQDRFDLIFLDGGHSASAVYQEIPRALNVLRGDGVILLHDYFPDNRPLWNDSSVIPGPYSAVTRLQSEGARLKILPLGDLLWQTKPGSRKTSLALVVSDHQSNLGTVQGVIK